MLFTPFLTVYKGIFEPSGQSCWMSSKYLSFTTRMAFDSHCNVMSLFLEDILDSCACEHSSLLDTSTCSKTQAIIHGDFKLMSFRIYDDVKKFQTPEPSGTIVTN